MPTQYLLNGEWVSLERFRKDKGIGVEKEVIEIKTEPEEPVAIVEPEIKEEDIKIITENYAKKVGTKTKKEAKKKGLNKKRAGAYVYGTLAKIKKNKKK